MYNKTLKDPTKFQAYTFVYERDGNLSYDHKSANAPFFNYFGISWIYQLPR